MTKPMTEQQIDAIFHASRPSQSGTLFQRDIICPNVNCNYQGSPRSVARGSFLVGMLLLCLAGIPGLLYFAFMRGYRYYCPKCGNQVAADN
jgi:hypothetical protein